MDAIDIFVGTYEEFLLGFKVEQPDKAENNHVLKQSLVSRDHSASVRCVVSMGNYVATGGADDRAFIYDIQKRSIAYIIINHAGTINTLSFSPDGKYLLAGSDDGSISITRMGTWTTDKIWKNAHKGSSVKNLSIHPSGKLALSIGNDSVLRTWNLIKGRQAYATNLKTKTSLGNVENVEWAPDGKKFIVSGSKAVEIMSVDEAKVVFHVECKSKPCAICWIDENEFLVGLENGEISRTSLLDHESIIIKLFDKRIKGISSLGDYLAIITSSGEVALCKIIKGKSIEKICSTNIDCRPTCITLVQSVYETESDDNTVPKIVEEHVKDKKVKSNIKPKLVVEIETDDVDSKTVANNIASSFLEKSTTQCHKSKADTHDIPKLHRIEPKKRTKSESLNEGKSKEVKKSKVEDNDSFINTSHKNSKKKKKRNRSLTVEPKLSTEKLSKKLTRKSVV